MVTVYGAEGIREIEKGPNDEIIFDDTWPPYQLIQFLLQPTDSVALDILYKKGVAAKTGTDGMKATSTTW